MFHHLCETQRPLQEEKKESASSSLDDATPCSAAPSSPPREPFWNNCTPHIPICLTENALSLVGNSTLNLPDRATHSLGKGFLIEAPVLASPLGYLPDSLLRSIIAKDKKGPTKAYLPHFELECKEGDSIGYLESLLPNGTIFIASL